MTRPVPEYIERLTSEAAAVVSFVFDRTESRGAAALILQAASHAVTSATLAEMTEAERVEFRKVLSYLQDTGELVDAAIETGANIAAGGTS